MFNRLTLLLSLAALALVAVAGVNAATSKEAAFTPATATSASAASESRSVRRLNMRVPPCPVVFSSVGLLDARAERSNAPPRLFGGTPSHIPTGESGSVCDELRRDDADPLPRPHPPRTLLILGVAALAFALAQTTLIPALRELARALDTDASGVAWTLTGYLLAAAVCTPVFGRLGDMFGKRRLLVISLARVRRRLGRRRARRLARLVVAGRVLQGVGGGIFPLCFGIIRDEFPRERVARASG